MNKPKILLSWPKNNTNYSDAVTGAGGEPVDAALPLTQEGFDGLILCGGADIDPKYYGEPIDGSRAIDPERDSWEFALLDAFVKGGKPVLGICRGCQLINVYFGGSLHQHLPTTVRHASGMSHDLIHAVTAEPGSVEEGLYGSSFVVNSYHHQAVRAIGKGLRITMRDPEDGTVEAIAHESLPVYAVQWHPERMSFAKRRPDTVDGALLIRWFVERCKTD